jgi:pimeloyl-ACP methyl ester carboxylesterase
MPGQLPGATTQGGKMRVTGCSRRRFLSTTLLAMLALPLAHAWAAPFASDRITVRVEGSGPDVILIPGMNSSPRTWASTVAAVPGYRYHLVQVSGFAGQPAGANKDGAFLVPVAEEIARYIKDAGLKQPAVVGHSLGGTFGMLVAARHPDALSRLMVVDMVPNLGAVFAGPGADAHKVQMVADRVATAIASATPEQRRQNATATIAGMVDNEAMRSIGVEDSLASDPAVGSRAYRELLTTDLGPELPRITVPVTVLYIQPKAVPVPAAQFDAGYKAWYAGVPHVTLTRIDDSAHFIMWDQPDRFQAALKAFLAGQ